MRTCLFTDKPSGLLGLYGPGYSIHSAELAVAQQSLQKFWDWNQTILLTSFNLVKRKS